MKLPYGKRLVDEGSSVNTGIRIYGEPIEDNEDKYREALIEAAGVMADTKGECRIDDFVNITAARMTPGFSELAEEMGIDILKNPERIGEVADRALSVDVPDEDGYPEKTLYHSYVENFYHAQEAAESLAGGRPRANEGFEIRIKPNDGKISTAAALAIGAGIVAAGAGAYAYPHFTKDTDKDGLPDHGFPFISQSDPHPYEHEDKFRDDDGDGISNYDDPHPYEHEDKFRDDDGDGISNYYDPHPQEHEDKFKDTDGDGLNDYKEKYETGTDYNNPDTDGDTLIDSQDPNPKIYNDLKRDSDGDGLTDFDEFYKYHTDMTKTDTDGDKVSDKKEIEFGTNPLKQFSYDTPIDDFSRIFSYYPQVNIKDSQKDEAFLKNIANAKPGMWRPFDGDPSLKKLGQPERLKEAFDISLNSPLMKYYADKTEVKLPQGTELGKLTVNDKPFFTEYNIVPCLKEGLTGVEGFNCWEEAYNLYLNPEWFIYNGGQGICGHTTLAAASLMHHKGNPSKIMLGCFNYDPNGKESCFGHYWTEYTDKKTGREYAIDYGVIYTKEDFYKRFYVDEGSRIIASSKGKN